VGPRADLDAVNKRTFSPVGNRTPAAQVVAISRQKNTVVIPAGFGTKNGCADEDPQKFTQTIAGGCFPEEYIGLYVKLTYPLMSFQNAQSFSSTPTCMP
jgi:hypothetical protein